MPVSESDLIKRATAGDASAMHQIVNRHADDLFALACTLLHSRADAEDALQETMLGALRGIGKFEGRSSLRTWLTRILVNQIWKIRRKRTTERSRTFAEQGDDDQPPVDRKAEGSAAQVERKIDVQSMLNTLSEEHRQILVLRELEGMSYDEISQTLRIPPGTVESRLFRARQQLKAKFKDYL